jgi:hypothetical protein
MPRLRAVRTKEDGDKIPVDQPVQVVLTEEPEIETEVETAPPEEEVPEVKEPEVKEPEPSAREVELSKQLEDLRKAEQSAREALIRANREKDEIAKTSRSETSRLKSEAEIAQYDAIITALASADTDAEKAQADIERATEIGDIKAQAEAYRRLAKAEATRMRLEEGKVAFDQHRESAKKEPAQEEPSADQRFESAISALPDSAKTWLRSHPEYITDPAKNGDIQYYHQKVVREEGKTQFSPEYYESLETHLGLREKPKAAAVEDDDDEDIEVVPAKTRRNVVTQAPPSRESVSLDTGKKTSTRVELSAEERAIAAASHISDVDYARNKLKLQQLKRNGHYMER